MVGKFHCTVNGSLSAAPQFGVLLSYDISLLPVSVRSATLTGSWGSSNLQLLAATTTVSVIAEDSLDVPLPLSSLINLRNQSAFDSTGAVVILTAEQGTLSYPAALFTAAPYTNAVRVTQLTIGAPTLNIGPGANPINLYAANIISLAQLLGVIDPASGAPVPGTSLLSAVGYTPPLGYIGVDSVNLTVVCSSRGLIESQLLAISVQQINHPPVVTVPLMPVPMDPQVPVYLNSVLLNISDPDGTDQSQISVTVSEPNSGAPQFLLTSQPPLGVACTVAVGSLVSSLQLVGPLSLVLLTLQSVQFSDPSQPIELAHTFHCTCSCE